jgi:hypothetical protein
MAEGTKRYALEEVERLFKAWRKQKKHRSSPIPAELWKAAISLTKEYSIFTVATCLRLDFNEFKKRIANKNAEEESTPLNFIELNAIPATEVTVDIERPDGVTMRVSIKDKGGLDIIELGRAFWSNR